MTAVTRCTTVLPLFAIVMLWNAANMFLGRTSLIRHSAIAHLTKANLCPACLSPLEKDEARSDRRRCTGCRAVW